MTVMPGHAPPDPASTVPQTDEGTGHERIVWRRLLQRKLLLRVTIPTVIGLVQLVLALMAISAGNARPVALLSLVPALAIGFIFGRSTRIAWDDERAQIALLQAQVVLAISYFVVRIGSHFLLEATLRGRVNDVATVLLLVSCGLFIGRSIGLSVQIWHVLVDRNSRNATSAQPQ